MAGPLRAAGMNVEQKTTKAPNVLPQLKGAPLGRMVYATRTGTGSKKVLPIAYVDTVYPTGTVARQPFRIESGTSATAQGGDMARLATSCIAFVEMKVTGKARHAGAAPCTWRRAG